MLADTLLASVWFCELVCIAIASMRGECRSSRLHSLDRSNRARVQRVLHVLHSLLLSKALFFLNSFGDGSTNACFTAQKTFTWLKTVFYFAKNIYLVKIRGTSEPFYNEYFEKIG